MDGEDPELSGLERRLLELAAEDREIERQEEEQAAAELAWEAEQLAAEAAEAAEQLADDAVPMEEEEAEEAEEAPLPATATTPREPPAGVAATGVAGPALPHAREREAGFDAEAVATPVIASVHRSVATSGSSHGSNALAVNPKPSIDLSCPTPVGPVLALR